MIEENSLRSDLRSRPWDGWERLQERLEQTPLSSVHGDPTVSYKVPRVKGTTSLCWSVIFFESEIVVETGAPGVDLHPPGSWVRCRYLNESDGFLFVDRLHFPHFTQGPEPGDLEVGFGDAHGDLSKAGGSRRNQTERRWS